jgi:hypothetical protein
VKWLAAAGLGSWLAVVRLISWFPWSIDQQLRLDSGLGMVEYQVLAVLSEAPQRTMRMSSLAVLTNASLSRLWNQLATPGSRVSSTRPVRRRWRPRPVPFSSPSRRGARP